MTTTPQVRACAEALQGGWSAVEAALLSATRFPSFARFLADYRGLPRPVTPGDGRGEAHPSALEQAEAQSAIGDALFATLRDAYRTASSSLPPSRGTEAPSPPAEPLATVFERVLNLALFLWSGAGDRNFQYRTVVHFAALDGLGDEIEEGVVLSFCESGVRLGAPGSEHFPRRLPLSDVLVDDSLLGHDAKLVARLRSLQRETCLLVDEWEHENALLAVEHTRIRQSLAGATPARLEAALGEILGRMGRLRDALSVWALQSFTSLQAFVSRVEAASANADVLLECDAAHALLLSGLQKIHLPASVSRHRYAPDTFHALRQWCDVRLAAKPEDVSTRLLRVALDVGDVASPSVVEGVQKAVPGWHELEAAFDARTHEWSLDYDPSSGLKACCWRLPRGTHVFLCALLTVLVARKLSPSKLGVDWLSILASLVQMPETYPGLAGAHPAAGVPASAREALPSATFVDKVARDVASALSPEVYGDGAGGVEADCVNYLRQAFRELSSHAPSNTPDEHKDTKETMR